MESLMLASASHCPKQPNLVKYNLSSWFFKKNFTPSRPYKISPVVPTGCDDLLFLWCDGSGTICPMVKSKAITHINTILKA
jgi:hypothetical protein